MKLQLLKEGDNWINCHRENFQYIYDEFYCNQDGKRYRWSIEFFYDWLIRVGWRKVSNKGIK